MAQQGSVYDPKKEKKGEGANHTPRQQLPPSDEALRDITGIDKASEAAVDKDALEHAKAGGFYKPRGDSGVYDPEREQEGETAYHAPRPQLPPSDQSLSDIPDKKTLQSAEAGGLYNSRGDTGAKAGGKAESPSSLNSSEEAGDEDEYPQGFYSPKNSNQNQKNFKSSAEKKRSKLWIVGALGGGGIISVIISLLLLIPLKIETMIHNLENRFFSLPTLSLNLATTHMFSRYIVSYVVPAYKNCGTTINRHCHVAVYNPGANPVKNMYHAWAQDRLEQKLYTDYGISFELHPNGHTYMVINDVTKGAGEYVGQDANGLEHFLATHSDIKAIVENSLDGETKASKLLFRYKIGRLLKIKYGQPRCIFFCETRTTIHHTILGAKTAGKTIIVQRVIAPYNQSLGIALECILTNCDATKTQPTDPSTDPGQNGFPENAETDTAIRTTLGDVAAQYAGADLAQAQALYEEISSKGFQNYFVEKGVLAITGSTAISESAVNAIPLIGWANLAFKTYGYASRVGPELKKLRYLVVVPAAIDLYLTYRTESDELHTGNVDPVALGSLTQTLGPGNNGNPHDPELGGTASAEQAPMYAAINNDNTNYTTGSLLSSILPGTALAASPTAPTDANSTGPYLCNNNQPVPAGQPVCPEEVAGGGSAIANSVHTFLTTNHFIGGIFFPGSEISAVANIWNKVSGWISGAIGGLIGDFLGAASTALDAECSLFSGASAGGIIPIGGINPVAPYCDGKALLKKAIPAIFSAFVSAVIPSPVGTNMSGGRAYEVSAMGADAASNTYAQEGLGGKEVSPAVTSAMLNQAQTEERDQFQHEPFFARMFDTSSSFSLVSKLALATPTDLQATADSGFAGLISDPLRWLSNGFASLFSSSSMVSAATLGSNPQCMPGHGTPGADAFCVPQYAADVPNGDLGSYWDTHCSDNPAQAYESNADYTNPAGGPHHYIGNWNQDTANNVDPINGMPESKTSNPCLIIKTATGIDGGLFDTSLLTPDDLADVPPSN